MNMGFPGLFCGSPGYQSFKLRPVPRANIGVGIAAFLEVVTVHQSLPRYSSVEHPISAWDIHTEGPSHSTFSDRDIQLMGSPAAESHHFPQLSGMLTRENSGPLEGSHNLWPISWCLMTFRIQWIIWIWGNPNFDLGLQISMPDSARFWDNPRSRVNQHGRWLLRSSVLLSAQCSVSLEDPDSESEQFRRLWCSGS